jgi:hypothetical protein
MLKRTTVVLLVLSVFLPVTAKAVNYKKDYCGNADYVGNTGAKYPHLHCGKSFFTLSKSTGHINFNGRGNCNKVEEVLADKQNQYGTAADPGAITTALESYQGDGCP